MDFLRILSAVLKNTSSVIFSYFKELQGYFDGSSNIYLDSPLDLSFTFKEQTLLLDSYVG